MPRVMRNGADTRLNASDPTIQIIGVVHLWNELNAPLFDFLGEDGGDHLDPVSGGEWVAGTARLIVASQDECDFVCTFEGFSYDRFVTAMEGLESSDEYQRVEWLLCHEQNSFAMFAPICSATYVAFIHHFSADCKHLLL
jgi:hypothetical protein